MQDLNLHENMIRYLSDSYHRHERICQKINDTPYKPDAQIMPSDALVEKNLLLI